SALPDRAIVAIQSSSSSASERGASSTFSPRSWRSLSALALISASRLVFASTRFRRRRPVARSLPRSSHTHQRPSFILFGALGALVALDVVEQAAPDDTHGAADMQHPNLAAAHRGAVVAVQGAHVDAQALGGCLRREGVRLIRSNQGCHMAASLSTTS